MIENIVRTIFFKRNRFSSLFSFLLLLFISWMGICPCIRRRVSDENKRKIRIFKNGEKKFLRELDVVNLL